MFQDISPFLLSFIWPFVLRASPVRKSSLGAKRAARRHLSTFVFIAMGHAQSGYHGVDAVVLPAMVTSGNDSVRVSDSSGAYRRHGTTCSPFLAQQIQFVPAEER